MDTSYLKSLPLLEDLLPDLLPPPKDDKKNQENKNKGDDKENVVDADFEDVKEDKEKSA